MCDQEDNVLADTSPNPNEYQVGLANGSIKKVGELTLSEAKEAIILLVDTVEDLDVIASDLINRINKWRG